MRRSAPLRGSRAAPRLSRARAAALAVALLAPGAARAQETGGVRVRLRTILASSKGKEIDPRLKVISKRLEDFRFTSYKLLEEHVLDMAFNSPSRVKLPGERMLKLTAYEVEKEEKIKIHTEMEQEGESTPRLHADYAIEARGDLVIGGPKYGDDVLLVWLKHEKK